MRQLYFGNDLSDLRAYSANALRFEPINSDRGAFPLRGCNDLQVAPKVVSSSPPRVRCP